MKDEGQSVQTAPGNEGPCRPVPKSAEQHGRHQIAIGRDLSGATAAERDVNIVAQPARKRDVPPTPKIIDGRAGVWDVEILGNVESEPAGHPDCHQRIAGKVKVNEPGKGKRRTDQSAIRPDR